MLTHGAVASRFLGQDVVYRAFDNWRTAEVRPEARAALGMLDTLTLRPRQFGPGDLAPLLELQAPLAAIEQALIVGYLFHYQNRMADALGADIPADKVERAGAVLNLTSRARLRDRRTGRDIASSGGRIPAEVQDMVAAVLDGPGDTDVALRRAVFDRGMRALGQPAASGDLPRDLAPYVDSVLTRAAAITDQDVQALLAAGRSEPEVFEITVAASTSAGYGRLLIAWEALSNVRGGL